MKKIILFIALLSFSLFFAQPAQAIYVQVTFNITSVTAPGRTGEVAMCGSSQGYNYEIVNSSGNLIAKKSHTDTSNCLRRNTPGSPGGSYPQPTLLFQPTSGVNYTPRISQGYTSWGNVDTAPDSTCTSGVPNGAWVLEIWNENHTQISTCTLRNNDVPHTTNYASMSAQTIYFNFPTISF